MAALQRALMDYRISGLVGAADVEGESWRNPTIVAA